MMKWMASAVAMLMGLALIGGGLIGCGGPSCPPGEAERAGECEAIDSDGCFPDEHYDSDAGDCVPVWDCPDGQTYDADAEECVEGLDCGENTEQQGDQCVAEDPVDCGDNTQLGPNENECIVTDEVCDAGTAFSEDDGTCVPTDEVCDEGTEFDEDSGLCYPEVDCQPGDVVYDGECISEAQQMYEEADVVADGDTDPSSGSPEYLDVDAVGDEVTFAGVIDGADGGPVDYFEFSAEEGDWIEVSVYSAGLPDPMLKIEEDGGSEMVRYTAAGTGNEKSRKFIAPSDGDYHLSVHPGATVNMQIGGDDWNYAGSIEVVDPEEAVEHDFDDEHFSGEFGPVADSFVTTDEFDADEPIQITWEVPEDEAPPEDVKPVVQLWSSPTDFEEEFVPETGPAPAVTVPETGEVYLVFDWEWKLGDEGPDYEFSVGPGTDLEPYETYELDFSADDGDAVRADLDWEGFGTPDVTITITDDDGETQDLVEAWHGGAEFGDAKAAFHLEGGDYTVAYDNVSGDSVVEGFVPLVDIESPTVVDDFDVEYGEVVDVDYSSDDFMSDYGVFVEAIDDDGQQMWGPERFPLTGFDYEVPDDAEHTIKKYNFDDMDVDVDVQVIELTELDTFDIASAEHGHVVEFGHDHQNDLKIIVINNDTNQIVERQELSDDEDPHRLVAMESGNYSIHYREEFGPDPDNVDVDINHVQPDEIDDFDQDYSGEANEHEFGDHDFYILEPDDTTTYEVTIEHDGGDGIGRFQIYGIANELLEESWSFGGTFGDVETVEREFQGGETYVIRVGGIAGFSDDDFDYTLSFEEQ